MQLSEAVERFERGLVGKGASNNTVATYRRNLRLLTQHFNGTEVEEISSADLADFLYAVRLKRDGTPKNHRTLNAIKTALKSFFKSPVLKNNPADDLRIKCVRIERDPDEFLTSQLEEAQHGQDCSVANVVDAGEQNADPRVPILVGSVIVVPFPVINRSATMDREISDSPRFGVQIRPARRLQGREASYDANRRHDEIPDRSRTAR